MICDEKNTAGKKRTKKCICTYAHYFEKNTTKTAWKKRMKHGKQKLHSVLDAFSSAKKHHAKCKCEGKVVTSSPPISFPILAMLLSPSAAGSMVERTCTPASGGPSVSFVFSFCLKNFFRENTKQKNYSKKKKDQRSLALRQSSLPPELRPECEH